MRDTLQRATEMVVRESSTALPENPGFFGASRCVSPVDLLTPSPRIPTLTA